jgi:uncharacterized cupin superfamily protein
MKVLSSNKNVKYFCGSFTTLSSFWHAENVLLDESKLFYITEGEIVIRTEFGETVCKKGDVVLIAGKGHETYQEIKGVKHHFDDKEIILN